MAILDPEIQSLLVQKRYSEEHPSDNTFKASLEKASSAPLNISVQFEGMVEGLAQLGMTVADSVGNIHYGTIPLANLDKLAQSPQVISIKKQRKRNLMLSSSVPDIRANQVWTRSGDSFTGYTGRDVLIGIIDTGIDIFHEGFRKVDGSKSTRIRKIWDQTLDKTGHTGETSPGPITNPSIRVATEATPLGYGVEYDFNQINNTLANVSGTLRVRHVDENGHGSHVAGITGGDGSQAGSCKGQYSYIGVAPEAEFIIVRLWGLSASDSSTSPTSTNVFIDAIKYILNEAATLSKPVSINISLGLYTDQPNGKSDDSTSIDTLLTKNSTGNAIIIAAGNDGDANFHAKGTVEATPAITELRFKIFPGDSKTRHLSILYTGDDIKVQLTSPLPGGGANSIVSWVNPGGNGTSGTANGTNGSITVTNDNTAKKISITITNPPSGVHIADTWKIELQNTGANPVSFDAFCLYGSSHDRLSPHFLNHTTTQTTISEEGSTEQAITVGSYKVGNPLSSFSGRGMTLDLRVKPEICAPGEGITSAAIPADRVGDTCKNCCCTCCQDFYSVKGGTSMAAPHVTGVVALMLHKNKTLTHTQIKNYLADNHGPIPSGATSEELFGWGVGKVDAKAVVDIIPQVTPPASGPPVPFTAIIPDHFSMIQERFLGTVRGPEFFRLFSRYFDEIKLLINKNKKIATVWHRIYGPIWVKHALRTANNPGLKFPAEIDGLSFSDSLSKLIPIMKKYASPQLVHDFSLYENELVHFNKEMTMDQLIDLFGNGMIPSVIPDNSNQISYPFIP